MKVKIINKNGFKFFEINGELYETTGFRSFRPDEDNIKCFYKAGVRFMSILCSGMTCTLDVPYSHYGESLIGENQYNFSTIDKQIDMFIKNAPDAYFNIVNT